MEINNEINNFLKIDEKIKEKTKEIIELKKEKNSCEKNIKSFLNESNNKNIEIGNGKIISIVTYNKKINLPKKKYEEHVKKELYNFGITDIEFINNIMNKTSNIIKEQKIKIQKK